MPRHPDSGRQGQRSAGALSVAVLVCLLAGCAARQSADAAGRQAHANGTPAERTAPDTGSGGAAPNVNRAAMPLITMGDRIELSDQPLARALKALDISPTSETYRRVAVEYRRLQVFDRAHEYFSGAVKLDPRNAAAFDGLARTWRDWGLPRMGLAHAYMAVHLAPGWAAAQNTLGTMLYVLGNGPEARRRFERAVSLDPAAAYAVNNLCYLSFIEGNEVRAVAECTDALARDPKLTAARNNLALVHAAAGRIELSEREFLASGNRGIGFYNLGIVHMARREYPKALMAFETALRERPSLWEAEVRAREARTLAARPAGPGDSIRN